MARSASETAQVLIEAYNRTKRRYTLTKAEMREMSGKERLRASFLEDVNSYLLDDGFVLVELQDEEGRRWFVIVRTKFLAKRGPLPEEVLDDLKVEELDEEEEDEEEEDEED